MVRIPTNDMVVDSLTNPIETKVFERHIWVVWLYE